MFSPSTVRKVSRKGMPLDEVLMVNFIVECIVFNQFVNVINSSSVQVKMAKTSSIYLFHTNGFIGALGRLVVSRLSMKIFAYPGAR